MVVGLIPALAASSGPTSLCRYFREAGADPAMTGEFTILAFPDLAAPDVVYLENMTSDLYVEQKPRCTATAWPLTGSAP